MVSSLYFVYRTIQFYYLLPGRRVLLWLVWRADRRVGDGVTSLSGLLDFQNEECYKHSTSVEGYVWKGNNYNQVILKMIILQKMKNR